METRLIETQCPRCQAILELDLSQGIEAAPGECSERSGGFGATQERPGGIRCRSHSTAARPASGPAGTDLDDLAERVYRLLQEDLRLGRLRRDGER